MSKRILTTKEAQANAEKWMRYTHDFIIRFVRHPLARLFEWIAGWNILNEGFDMFIHTIIWMAATAFLIFIHMQMFG